MPGYSRTPLPQKLGLRAPMTLVTMGAPRGYRGWLAPLPAGVRVVSATKGPVRAVHAFVTERAALARVLAGLRDRLEPDGFAWISWPKRSSGVATDVTEDVVRELALPLGLVDVKVCAVTDVWSGLKLVVRRSARPPRPAER